MSTYFISDIHGCYQELKILLDKSNFNDQKDYLWIAGDLVSRGPDSLKVLRYLYSLKNRVKIVLGNHDINLIAVYSSVKKNKKENFFDEVLVSEDSSLLINWLRHQPLLQIDKKRKIIMVHAGISPQWDLSHLQSYASDIEEFLSDDNYPLFLEAVYSNSVYFWSSRLSRLDRLRYSMNVFTRMRYCYPDGSLNMFYKQSPHAVKDPLQPWFLMQNKIEKNYSIFFGHWSSLKGTYVPKPFFSLDAGCCWGGELNMLRWDDKKIFSQSFISQ